MTREIKSVLAAVIILILCLWCVLSFAQGWPAGPVTRWMTQEPIEACSRLFSGSERNRSESKIDPVLPKEIVTVAQAAVENYFCRDLDEELGKITVKCSNVVESNNQTPVAGRFTPDNMTIEMVYWPENFSAAWHCGVLAHEYVHAIGYLLSGKLDVDHYAYKAGYEKVDKYCVEELGE